MATPEVTVSFRTEADERDAYQYVDFVCGDWRASWLIAPSDDQPPSDTLRVRDAADRLKLILAVDGDVDELAALLAATQQLRLRVMAGEPVGLPLVKC